MRPYLGILKDSFREALASRVLWILLALTTVFLLAVAPLGISEQKPLKLARNSVARWTDLAAKLVDQGQAEKPSPARQIWKRLPPELQTPLAETRLDPENEFPPSLPADLLNQLNKALDDREFYSAAAWEGIDLPEEARTLRDRGVAQLSNEELTRFNRLLLEAAFPAEIPPNNSTETGVTYLGWTLTSGLPLNRTQLTPVLRLFVSAIINIIVGALGGFAAILVTASMITQTFEAGSIDLLLSKPVNRSLVFLTKFLGGCIFVGLNACYFIAGLWLIMGLRFDQWIHKLWWCIPVYLFLFIVFYSVCALSGVLWRNTIVAIVLTIAFWGLGFLVDSVKTIMETFALNPKRIIQLTSAGPARFSTTERGQIREWQPQESRWDDVFATAGEPRRMPPGPFGPTVLGPIFDSQTQRLLAVQIPPAQGRRGFQLFPPAVNLLYAEQGDGWMRKEGPATPAGTRALFLDSGNKLLAVATDGVFRLEAAADVPLSKKSGKFVFLGPQPRLKLGNDSAASYDPAAGRVATWSNGEVTVLEPTADGKYQQVAQKRIDEEGKIRKGMCLAAAQCVIVVLEDGRILVLEPGDLSLRHEFHPHWYDAPRFTAVSGDGRFGAIVFHGGDLWLYDAREKRELRPRLVGQGDISAASFDGPNHLLVADRGTRVTRYQLDPFQREESIAPPMELADMAYHYAVQPLHTIVRKPVELSNVSSWLLMEQDSIANAGPESEDLRQSRTKLDAWGTLRHSAVFVAIVLGLTCFYISRKDF